MWCRSIAPGGARVGECYLGYWLAQSNQWYGAVLLCVWACCWLLADQAGDEQPPPSPASVFSTAMFFCAVCHCTSFYRAPHRSRKPTRHECIGRSLCQTQVTQQAACGAHSRAAGDAGAADSDHGDV